MKKHFDRLGLREEASWDEIQKAFNQKMERLRCRQYEDDPKGRKKDKDRRLLIRSYYALQEFEMNGRVVKTGMAKPENKQAVILLLIFLSFGFFWFSCEHKLDEAMNKEVDSYLQIGEVVSPTSKDLSIAEAAKHTKEILDSSGTPWTTYTGGKYYSEPIELIQKEADTFAKVYWNMDTIDDVHEYLCDTYPDYESVYNLEYIVLIEDYDGYDEKVDLCKKIDLICAFYGFYTKGQAHGKKDSYTKKGIGQYHTYLQFLNQCASSFTVEISRTLSLYRV